MPSARPPVLRTEHLLLKDAHALCHADVDAACIGQVVTAQASTSGQDADAVSVEASARVLRAFASAWVAAGHAESELIHLVVKASEGVPARSRLPLLTALSAPLPSVSPSNMIQTSSCQPGIHCVVSCTGGHGVDYINRMALSMRGG